MQLFKLLSLYDADITPKQSKVHLATWNGEQHPIDVYLAGKFEDWQRWQSKRNFGRKYVVSLITLREANKWLFAGVHLSGVPEQKNGDVGYWYPTQELQSCRELNGRLIVSYPRPSNWRQPYLRAESADTSLTVSELRPEKLSIQAFPGYRNVLLTRDELCLITGQSLDSWRAALSSVAGVYVIADSFSGKLYVGSASGEGGIWARWTAYAATGHGGNVELKQLLQKEGKERAASFRFSILEIADIHESDEDILNRESHWKRVLLSREHGFNSN